MQGKFKAERKLAGAVSFGLTLSLSLSATASDSLSATSIVADAGGFASISATPGDTSSVIGRWREYALSGVTPDFSWADHSAAKAQAPSVLDNFTVASTASSSTVLWRDDATHTDIRVSVTGSNLPETRGFSSSSVRGTLLPDPATGVHRDFVSPTFEQRWGNQGIWGVSGVLAYQRHTTLGFGTYELHGENTYASSAASAYGTGMSLGVANTLTDSLRWSVGFRSKISVDDYNRAAGVYSQPGIYDIPASYRVGLAYGLSQNQSLDLRAESIQYSGTTPYIGVAPPSRIGAGGGDGSVNSIYAQRDLLVYSLGWTWHAGDYGDWQLRYSTREQPLPASDALYQALKYRLSNYSVALSFGKTLSKYSELRFAASYAPTEYLFGAPDGYLSRNGGNQTELEALYLVHF